MEDWHRVKKCSEQDQDMLKLRWAIQEISSEWQKGIKWKTMVFKRSKPNGV